MEKKRIQLLIDEDVERRFREDLAKRGAKKGDISGEITTLIRENLSKIKTKFPLYFQNKKDIDDETKNQIELFYEKIDTFEKELGRGLVILKDKKSGALYAECHLKASELVENSDLDSQVNPDPEEQEEYFKMNRDIQKNHPSFKKMIYDAKNGRQFSDLVMEFNLDYKPQKPLKILGGQHRIMAIEEAFKSEKINRIHGIRIYFNLDVPKRIEIADIANTNINLSLDLRDRMYEEGLEPPGKLMEWCKKIGFLEKGENFAERRLKKQDRPTVRMMRSFIINFYEGKKYSKDIKQNAIVPQLPDSGGMDAVYSEIYRKLKGNFIGQRDLTNAAEEFFKLHEKQLKTAPEEYKYRVLNLAVISSWAFVAGYLQKNSKELRKLYRLPINSGNQNPLNSAAMDRARHDSDPINYRMGVRFGEKERGRLTQLFYRYAISDKLIQLNLKAYNESITRYNILKEEDSLSKSSSVF